MAPTPELGRTLSRSKIAAALRRGGRQLRVDERAVEVQAALPSDQLAASAEVSAAMGASVAVIATMSAQVASWPRSWKRVLSGTRTPWWSVPCQDWGPSWAPGC